jgi:hypothetical protein
VGGTSVFGSIVNLVHSVTSVGVVAAVTEVLKARIFDSSGNAFSRANPLPASLHDAAGNSATFTAQGALRAATANRIVGSIFEDAVDANFWALANSGTASAAAIGSGICTLTSGSDAAGYGQVQSVNKARFIFATLNEYRGLVRVPVLAVADCTRRWGDITTSATTTPLNGFYFEVSGAGVLSVNHVSDGSVTSAASGSFNGTVDSYTLDTNVHAYEVLYFQASAQFYVDGVLVHTFTPGAAPLCELWHHNATATCINGGTGGVSGVLQVYAHTIQRIGEINTASKSKYNTGTTAATVLKIGPGSVHGILLSAIGNNSAVTLYDNTAASGTVLFASGAMPNNTTPLNLGGLDLPFEIGLTLVVATTSSDVVVSYE